MTSKDTPEGARPVTREVEKLSALGTRLPEQGRIRLGVKSGRAMKAIDTFRFTSPSKDAILALAGLYGGVARPWSDPMASPQGQWEVITTSNRVRVLLPPGALAQSYELWQHSGCVRRCDGELCVVPGPEGPAEVPCLCVTQGTLQCRVHSRLNVIIPELPFGGVWRMETKGWNAAKELPRMEWMLEQLAAAGIVEAFLLLERRTSGGGSKRFVVPKLELGASVDQMLAGVGTVQALKAGEAMPPVLALDPVDAEASDPDPDPDPDPGPIEDAEELVVTPGMVRRVEAMFREAAPNLDPALGIAAMCRQVSDGACSNLPSLTWEQFERCSAMLERAIKGLVRIQSISDGKLVVISGH